MALEDVSEALWQERELLERLLFKLEEELALLRSGSSRWLARGGDEIKAVLAALESAEQSRRELWAATAAELGLPPDATLKALIERAGFPWNTILAEHQRSLNAAAREIEEAATHEHLEGFGAQHATQALTWLRPQLRVA